MNQTGQYSVLVGDETGWFVAYAWLEVYTPRFSEWQALRFSPAELSDRVLTGPDGDADGDGISNLLEYAFHLDPKKADNTVTTMASIESDGTDSYFTFAFLALRSGDLSYTVGVSDDLATWDWSENDIEYWGYDSTDDPATVQWKVRLTTPVQLPPRQKFFKLRVTCRPETFIDWQALFFTPSERVGVNAPGGLTADPDGDGLTNLLEYALGSDPYDASTLELPATFISQEGTNSYLNLKYRQTDTFDTSFEIGVSDDLIMWDWSGTQLDWVDWNPATDGLADEVTMRLSTPIELLQTRKFLKLKVTNWP